MSAAPQNYLDWAAEQQVFESMAAIASGWLTLREPGVEPESLVPQRVTAGFFNVLRVASGDRPARSPSTTRSRARDRVAVLSDGLWRRRSAPIRRSSAARSLSRRSKAATRHGGVTKSSASCRRTFAYPVGAASPDRPLDSLCRARRTSASAIRRASTSICRSIARLKPGVRSSRRRRSWIRSRPRSNGQSRVEQGQPVGVRPLIDHLLGARIEVVAADAARRRRPRAAHRVRERRQPAARPRHARASARSASAPRSAPAAGACPAAARREPRALGGWHRLRGRRSPGGRSSCSRASMPEGVPRVADDRARPARARRRGGDGARHRHAVRHRARAAGCRGPI